MTPNSKKIQSPQEVKLERLSTDRTEVSFQGAINIDLDTEGNFHIDGANLTPDLAQSLFPVFDEASLRHQRIYAFYSLRHKTIVFGGLIFAIFFLFIYSYAITTTFSKDSNNVNIQRSEPQQHFRK